MKKYQPTPKVAASTAGAALVTIAVALGLNLSPEVAAAAATIVGFVLGWLKTA